MSIFVTRPLSLIFILCGVALFFYPILSAAWRRRGNRKAEQQAGRG